MAVENLEFSAQVDAWIRQSEQRFEAVFRESAQRVIAEMQKPVGAGGNMPVDTGFLRASLLATTGSPPQIRKDHVPEKGASYLGDDAAGQVALVIAGAGIGQTIYACYTAAYAAFVEYGTSKMAGRGFVRLAAQRWQQIVDQVVSEVRSGS